MAETEGTVRIFVDPNLITLFGVKFIEGTEIFVTAKTYNTTEYLAVGFRNKQGLELVKTFDSETDIWGIPLNGLTENGLIQIAKYRFELIRCLVAGAEEVILRTTGIEFDNRVLFHLWQVYPFLEPTWE